MSLFSLFSRTPKEDAGMPHRDKIASMVESGHTEREICEFEIYGRFLTSEESDSLMVDTAIENRKSELVGLATSRALTVEEFRQFAAFGEDILTKMTWQSSGFSLGESYDARERALHYANLLSIQSIMQSLENLAVTSDLSGDTEVYP